jgi:transketolase C-terminal domain/subunit
MAVNALHATVIKAFRDRLVNLGINPLEVIATASLGRGATGQRTIAPYCA